MKSYYKKILRENPEQNIGDGRFKGMGQKQVKKIRNKKWKWKAWTLRNK